jgi:hypothetical protein
MSRPATEGVLVTPFMIRVAELIGAEIDEQPEPLRYKTRPSTGVPVNVGADRHVAIRSLTEQLLCEANAVLADSDDHLGLFDELADGELAFNVTYRNHAVRISTTFEDGVAYGRLIGDGVDPGPAQELAGPEAVADLLILLLVSAGLPHHHVNV